MSIKVVRNELARFLKSPDPEILCLKGNWGVGKTYAWNHYLRQAAAANSVRFDNYAYVSLFGVNNLEELKYSLFESTKPVESLVREPSHEPIKQAFKRLRENSRRIGANIARIPGFQKWIGGSERMLFFLVRDQVVCLDDLERAGSGLSIRDVLGLALQLKEQRGCKVALLLNEEELSKDAREEFARQLEKVVDTRLNFEPTPSEAAEIALPEADDLTKLLHADCVKLGITNIRVIKRIQRLIERINAPLHARYAALGPQIVHSTTLLAWAVLQPGLAPDVSFLRDFSRIHGLFAQEKAVSDEEQRWQDIVRKYEWTDFDSFDAAILACVQQGFVDDEALLTVAEETHRRLTAEGNAASVENAWDLYHGSFDDDETTVLTAIIQASTEHVRSLSPSSLNATIRFLKDFERHGEAKGLLAAYIAARAGDAEAFNLDNVRGFGDKVDEDLVAAFDTSLRSQSTARDPKEILEGLATRSGWGQEDLGRLAELTPDDFYRLFKNTRGAPLHALLTGALYFARVANASPEMQKITQNAVEALQRIGRESRLNAKRVSVRGVSVPPPDKVP